MLLQAAQPLRSKPAFAEIPRFEGIQRRQQINHCLHRAAKLFQSERVHLNEQQRTLLFEKTTRPGEDAEFEAFAINLQERYARSGEFVIQGGQGHFDRHPRGVSVVDGLIEIERLQPGHLSGSGTGGDFSVQANAERNRALGIPARDRAAGHLVEMIVPHAKFQESEKERLRLKGDDGQRRGVAKKERINADVGADIDQRAFLQGLEERRQQLNLGNVGFPGEQQPGGGFAPSQRMHQKPSRERQGRESVASIQETEKRMVLAAERQHGVERPKQAGTSEGPDLRCGWTRHRLQPASRISRLSTQPRLARPYRRSLASAQMTLLGQLRYRHRAWKAGRRDERFEIAALRALIQPGDTVVDIGAHKGSYLWWLRNAAGSTGRVVAFEPQPSLHRYLAEVVASQGWTNVELRNQGVSSHVGNLTLHIPGAAGGFSPEASFESRAIEQGAAANHDVTVEVTTLDQVFPPGSRPPSVIKCDVEGHEHAVFQGGARLLREHGPALLFECESRHLGGRSVASVHAFLGEYGYSGEFFSPDGLRPISEFRPEIHQKASGDRFWDRPEYCNNFLFQRLAPAARPSA